jgi:hypothetical protein
VLDWPTKILTEELNIIVSLFCCVLCAVVLCVVCASCCEIVCVGCGLWVVGWVLGVELWNMMEHGTCRSVAVSSVDI